MCSFMHVIYELDKTVELKQEFESHFKRLRENTSSFNFVKIIKQLFLINKLDRMSCLILYGNEIRLIVTLLKKLDDLDF